MFRAPPAAHAGAVRADLVDAALRSLGRGVTYVLHGPELDALRAARSLLDELRAGSSGAARAEGLDLRRYAGGPWEADGGYAFRPDPTRSGWWRRGESNP